ncbi:MAG: AI-2E family transporter [Candidatus Electrothrix sp. AW2]|nr:AI-2E family transporter [Candidatus Electrothrix gigas]MCI5134636.1 AI-2E family transporter [Candidatus Electrothrix gigas]MCI5196301.1 AI-2E family transporter [Candidatus Electrothrix gigas]MCI5225557.1 AI-2E family transporter [Candidatus Electrothrix gigas]
MIKHQNVNKIILLIMVTAISALFLTMIRQFLMAIFMAGLFSAMTTPAHRWLTPRLNNRENLASILIIIALVCLLLIPLALLIGVVISQAVHVGQSVTPWIDSFVKEPTILSDYISKVPHYEIFLPYRDMILEKAGEIVGMISNQIIDSLGSLGRITINALFNAVIMLYVMFYFLTMGEVLLNKILYYLPMTHEDEERLLRRFTSVAGATMKSTLIIGILQGGLCGFAFFLAEIQGAVFWGTVMAVLSIIPAVGTAIVWIPALAILAIDGDFSGVFILAILCGAVAGNLDNLLRPRLVGKDTEMHDLFVLFGTLGGIALFGVLGIIIGPIISALFITIWEIYGDAFHEYLPEVGPLYSKLETKPKTKQNKEKNATEQDDDQVLPEE